MNITVNLYKYLENLAKKRKNNVITRILMALRFLRLFLPKLNVLKFNLIEIFYF